MFDNNYRCKEDHLQDISVKGEGRECGGKKLHVACPQGSELEPETFCVLDESPQLNTREVVLNRKYFCAVPKDKLG